MRAIDMHCHPSTKEFHEAFGRYVPGLQKAFNVDLTPKSEEAMADDFRRDGVMAMMIAWDAHEEAGLGRISNDWVASLTEKYPDVFLPGWAVVDPWKGKATLKELERAITELGLKGAKFQPPAQAFEPHDRRFYPMWELLQSLNAPVLIHSGTTGLGIGEPGGAGLKLRYGRPIPGIDDVAADFPNLTIISAHPSWPWVEEEIAMLVHKANVFLDVSGWRPRYIPEALKREINGRLQDKVLFGSDYPSFTSGKCLDELESEGYRPEVIEKLALTTPIRVLGLEARVG